MEVLARPRDQRRREHMYRCAQAIIFGLPVIVLQLWGKSLGGNEAERWVGFFQAVLTGWIVYVGASGMIVEGILLLRRRWITGDFIAGVAVVVLYVVSAISLLTLLFTGRLPRPMRFEWCVIILIAWTGLQWWRFSDVKRA